MPSTLPRYFQHSVTITAPSRGCHLITPQVLKAIQKDLQTIDTGLCNLFCQHTSASLTINENADPDVRTDMETALNKLVPAEWCRNGVFQHTMEGDDDMPGHVKSSLMGVSLTIPVRQPHDLMLLFVVLLLSRESDLFYHNIDYYDYRLQRADWHLERGRVSI